MKKQQEIAKQILGYRGVMIEKPTKPQLRLMVGIPATGLVRMEWVCASRTGQVIPCNWSSVEFIQYIDQYSPLNFMVADARNIIATTCVAQGFEWLLFIDHDVMLPANFLVTINDYMIKKERPVVSGLYFTKSVPSEPLVYRGRGTGYYADWKMGDKITCDGHGMGATLIHASLLRVLAEESEEYLIAGQKVKRIFETPQRTFLDPETLSFSSQEGTEDLTWCTRVMEQGIFKKAGWPEFQRKKWPFVVDSNLFCQHIDQEGTKYPARGEHLRFIKEKRHASARN